MEPIEEFNEDLAFILSLLTHFFIIFCLLFVLSRIRRVAHWLGLSKTRANSRKLDEWLAWLGLRKPKK